MLHWFAKRLHELHKEDRKGEKGFTLIELLVVVIIIGILAAIAIPTFLGQRARAQDAEAKAAARNSLTAAKTFYTDKQTYTGVMTAPAVGTPVPMKAIEPSLNYAATPDDTTSPMTVGVVVTSAQVIDIAAKSKTGKVFKVKSDESGAGTTYAIDAGAYGGSW